MSFHNKNEILALFFLLLVFGYDSIVLAEEKKAKGLDMISDTVTAAANKASAILTLNLEVTMDEDKDKYKYKDNYTVNAIGQRVPRATSTKTGDALHNERPL